MVQKNKGCKEQCLLREAGSRQREAGSRPWWLKRSAEEECGLQGHFGDLKRMYCTGGSKEKNFVSLLRVWPSQTWGRCLPSSLNSWVRPQPPTQETSHGQKSVCDHVGHCTGVHVCVCVHSTLQSMHKACRVHCEMEAEQVAACSAPFEAGCRAQ